MPLTPTNADAFATAYCTAQGITDTTAVARWKDFAEKLYVHLLSDATVTVGIPVTTVGGPATQTGATTAPGTLT